jgi:hypothetical protein
VRFQLWRHDFKNYAQQGDQIGRSFAIWAIVYFGQYLKNSLTVPVFELCTFSQTKLCINSAEEMCWATFWAFFHKSRLVTLMLQSPSAVSKTAI